jgi:phosphoadenosine phosphosulfate reductase
MLRRTPAVVAGQSESERERAAANAASLFDPTPVLAVRLPMSSAVEKALVAQTPADLDEINRALEGRPPQEVLRWAVETFAPDVILTCSFQHDGVALAHMMSRFAPWVPIVFLDTGFHFAETLAYKEDIARRFGLNLKEVKPMMPRDEFARTHGLDLYRRDPDLCCKINKVEPLRAALEGVRCWINGRRRDQTSTRKTIGVVERYEGGLHKVNPMAAWSAKDTYGYFVEHGIPEHPLFDKGYASIGCAPCTRPILAGEDERAGRWSGSNKTECGIHTFLKKE